MPNRVPISTASRKGVSWLTAEAENGPVTLTSFGRPAAVVLSPDDADRMHAELREVAQSIISFFVDRALDDHPATHSLDDVCARLGFDPAEIRERAVRET